MANTQSWAKSHPTGAREIDSTNECLQFVLAELFQNSLPCRGDAVSCRKLGDLERFLVRKFAREEELMATADFHGLAAHRSDHAILLARLATMRRELVCGAYDPDMVHAFLTDWAVGHVGSFDSEFGKFLAWRREKPEGRRKIGTLS